VRAIERISLDFNASFSQREKIGIRNYSPEQLRHVEGTVMVHIDLAIKRDSVCRRRGFKDHFTYSFLELGRRGVEAI